MNTIQETFASLKNNVMKVKQKTLLQELIKQIDNALVGIDKFRNLSLNQLNFKAHKNSWSILECIEHLNLYGKFYLPEIENALNKSIQATHDYYKSSFIGDFFINSISTGNKKKMKAPGNMLPNNSELTYSTLDMMTKQLESLKELILKAHNLDLTHQKTKISLTRFIKLRLGDTIRFVVYHIERHFVQAECVLEILRK